ncbi:MAG: PfkB family carbohydrate kinase, partial [Egibacteraceae bacterium]
DPDRRAGVYYVDPGVPPRPGEVLYDRADSAASALSPGQFDWGSLLDEHACLHTSGITPALGEAARKAVEEAFGVARDVGATTSFDINYRSRLWSVDEARACYQELLPSVDVLFASAHDLRNLLAAHGEAVEGARELRKRYGIATVVIPDRIRPAVGRVTVRVVVVTDGVTVGRAVDAQVIDPIGAGDALAGAFLASHLAGDSPRAAADAAGRAAALKHTIRGDALALSPHELDVGYGDGKEVLR